MVNKVWKICSRDHRFQKSSDCPICPICWSSYYRNREQNDFPQKLAAPALRALLNAKITKLNKLNKWTEKDLSKLHGMGPNALRQLKTAMRKNGLTFLKNTK